VDVSYINISGRFYHLTSVLDGYSRFMHWKIRESMTYRDVETIVQRALERYSNEKPWIISDNGPLFIERDFMEFVRFSGNHARAYQSPLPAVQRQNGTLARGL
jgi:transposase InsO family protein